MEAEAEASIPDISGLRQRLLLRADQFFPQMLEPASPQIVLARVVGVERRSADIRGIADVVDGDGVVALLKDQGNMGLLQQAPGAGDAPVNWSLCHASSFPGQIAQFVQ